MRLTNFTYQGASGSHCQWRSQYDASLNAVIDRFLRGKDSTKTGNFATDLGSKPTATQYYTWDATELPGRPHSTPHAPATRCYSADGRMYTASIARRLMAAKTELILEFSDAAEWEAWLARHHDRSGAVLLRIPKRKGSELTYARALDAALAWGWIDSQKRALDASAWLQRFSPRAAKSPWSKINRARAEALIASGGMKPPGLAEVERARADGRWSRAYDGARAAQVPPDLAGALARNARARTFFDALDSANRYAILWRVQTAKKPETRARRIEQFVALCAAGKTLHPTSRARAPRAKE